MGGPYTLTYYTSEYLKISLLRKILLFFGKWRWLLLVGYPIEEELQPISCSMIS